jgi:hypothetical protein
MLNEHHANTTSRTVIGNSIFAVSSWFLKSKKSSLRSLTRAMHSLLKRFLQLSMRGWVRRTLTFPKLTQIPKLGS